MACAATENAGPSPAPRMMRQIRSVVKLTVPTIGNCANDQITAIASSTQRVATRLTMKPTTMAEIENRKKNEEPSRPNSFGSSFSSVMMGTAARPTTILSAKFTSMNRNSRNVMVQAPFGVSFPGACAAMNLPRLMFFAPPAMLDMPFPPRQPGIFTGPRAVHDDPPPEIPPDVVLNAHSPHHDRVVTPLKA